MNERILGVSILSNVDDVLGHLTDIEYKHLPFVLQSTMNEVAFEARDEVVRHMDYKFTIRRNWVKRGVRVEKATKQNLSARIYTLDWLMAYMETGGTVRPFKSDHLWIPTLAARRGDSFEGVLKPGMRPKLIRRWIDNEQKGKKRRRKKAGKGKYKKPRPFMITGKSGKKLVVVRQFADKRLPIIPLYVLAKQARQYARWGFGETVDEVVAKRFRPAFFKNFEKALRTDKTGPKKSRYLSYMAEHGGNSSVADAMSKASSGLPSYSGPF